MIVNEKKRTCWIIKESKKRDNYLDLARELKKTMEHEGDGDTNCNRCASEQPPKVL